MELLLLAAALLLGLILVPLGLPGLWVMVGAGLIYNLLMGDGELSVWTVAAVSVLALIAELIEFGLAGRYARKYGGSRRAGWGAIIGGMVGAIMGVPIPIPFVGSMIGAFVGAFVGALAFEYTRREASAGSATRVATGALLGRVVAAGMKVAIGFVIMAWLLMAAWA